MKCEDYDSEAYGIARMGIPIKLGPEFLAIRNAVFHSMKKHGELPDSVSASGLILAEELLEAVEAGLNIIKFINDFRDEGLCLTEEMIFNFYKELAQNAAVSIKIMNRVRKENPEVRFFGGK